MKKVIQIIPALLAGDAVGNLVVAIDKLAKVEGFESWICAGSVHEKARREELSLCCDLSVAAEGDILIYHAASYCEMVDEFISAPGKKVLSYHNITPPEFFEGFNEGAACSCRDGLRQVAELATKIDYAMADSEFNKKDLESMGYRCPIDVVPVLVDFEEYRTIGSSHEVMGRWGHAEGTKVLFVGRMAPNKKIEDVIRSFACYQQNYDRSAQLLLVGGCSTDDLYYRSLLRYADAVGARKVIFSGHVSFADIVTYYRVADVFLCQSEHEGFCVPLLEAFACDVPVVAFDAAAVGETMGSAGILMKSKHPCLVARALDVATSAAVREQMIEQQQLRLHGFSYEVVSEKLMHVLKGIQENDG